MLATSRRTRVRMGVAGMFGGLALMATQSISERVDHELATRRALVQQQEQTRRLAEEQQREKVRQAELQRAQAVERQQAQQQQRKTDQERRRLESSTLAHGEILRGFNRPYMVIVSGGNIKIAEDGYLYFDGDRHGDEIHGYRYYNSCGGLRVRSIARVKERVVTFFNQDVTNNCQLASRNTQYILNRRR